jgi:DNA-binding ferritin-like protein
MARLEARVNLRLSQDVYDTYAKVGEKFNTSVTEMIREMVNDGVEIMQTIATIIDAAEAGDKEAAAKLLTLFMQSNEGRLELAKAVMHQELKSFGLQPVTEVEELQKSGQD